MFGESLYQCFSGHRRPPPLPPCPYTPTASTTYSSSSSRASTSGTFKNFNSQLYNYLASDSDITPLTLSSSGASCDAVGGSCPSERDLSTAIASRRLLPASPGRSNSIVDSAAVDVGTGAGVAVPTYSPDPYWDFRRSMEEMVAALGLDNDAAAKRAHLHDLLLCYLALNGKHAHKYIVSAFADLVLALAPTTATDCDV
ncbi:hypothetical protein Cni_G29459 [Canna indica]|uniref:Transcription repressor n=1 Tax=Canna indica TaxID=4628 RepID=A0AAQ3QRB3_9LILI|nr:hypothetical protein Cni_G29459 [Canna indica]